MLLRRLVHTRYEWARADYLRRLRRKVEQCADELIVYQMGKVGSSTVTATLRAAVPEMLLYHVHALRRENLEKAEGDFRRRWGERMESPRGVWQAQLLLDRMRTARPGVRWKVVTLVRDPIARNVSAFFEGLEPRHGFDYRAKLRALGLEGVVEELGQRWPRYEGHHRPRTWFDDQLRPVFDVDVFATEFPKERGTARYRSERADVLLLKLEKLNEVGAAALADFVGAEVLQLIIRRRSTERHYGAIYQRFRESPVLSAEYIDRMYSSRTARHFYTEEELAAFRERWSRCVRK